MTSSNVAIQWQDQDEDGLNSNITAEQSLIVASFEPGARGIEVVMEDGIIYALEDESRRTVLGASLSDNSFAKGKKGKTFAWQHRWSFYPG